MLKGIRNYILILFFILCISCENPNKILYNVENPNYKTIVWVYYGRSCVEHILYSKDSVYTCSYQGTNFLLEKNNENELFSTSAPIRILKCYKIENDD